MSTTEWMYWLFAIASVQAQEDPAETDDLLCRWWISMLYCRS